MKLIIGGKYQGKKDYAVNTLGISKSLIIDDYNNVIRQVMEEGGDPYAFNEAFMAEHGQCCFIIDEIGCGVIPVDDKDRKYRMEFGRIVCILAEHADSVYRVMAGLGLKIK